jgi:hypothetical protein
MKKLKLSFFAVSFLILFLSISISLYGDPDGRTGRTKKTSTSGCGGCHGSSAVTDVSVLISGADTVIAGQTNQYSLLISKPSKSGAGLDIATRNGVLAPVSSNIHLSNGELTQNSNIPMSGGAVTIQFNYTAPISAVTDTLWATGLATNSDGNSSGDDWNWAVSKRIIVKLPTGISSENAIADKFSLSQNYPNPFNPSTVIDFSIPVSGFVSLKVYNVYGVEVATLVSSDLNPGNYKFVFEGKNLSSGIYFYNLISGSPRKAGNFNETKRMMLIK